MPNKLRVSRWGRYQNYASLPQSIIVAVDVGYFIGGLQNGEDMVVIFVLYLSCRSLSPAADPLVPALHPPYLKPFTFISPPEPSTMIKYESIGNSSSSLIPSALAFTQAMADGRNGQRIDQHYPRRPAHL